MTKRERSRLLLIVILILSVGLRLGVALYFGDGFDDVRGGTYDQISYNALARRVVDGFGFSFQQDSWPYARADQPTAFWSYLYTGYLTAIYFVFGHSPLLARLLQALLVGVFTPLFLYRMGKRTFGERIGLFAAAIAAVYLYFITYAASLMTEAFYITGILWTMDIVTRFMQQLESEPEGEQAGSRRQMLGYGLELGLAMGTTLLLRQVVLFFFITMCIWLLWVGLYRFRIRAVVMTLLLSAFVLAVMLAPWMWRNYRVFGRVSLPNTNAGFTFFWSNHPIYGTRFEPVFSPERGVSYQELIPVELRDLNEAELDRALLQRGLEFVRDDPGRYLRLSLSRVPVYFLFWPTSNSSLLSNVARVLSFGLFMPFMVYGLVLSLIRGWQCWRGNGKRALLQLSTRPHFLFWLFIIVYTSLHLASWANVRYRLPVDTILILFAAYGIDHIATRYRYVWKGLANKVTSSRHLKEDVLGIQ